MALTGLRLWAPQCLPPLLTASLTRCQPRPLLPSVQAGPGQASTGTGEGRGRDMSSRVSATFPASQASAQAPGLPFFCVQMCLASHLRAQPLASGVPALHPWPRISLIWGREMRLGCLFSAPGRRRPGDRPGHLWALGRCMYPLVRICPCPPYRSPGPVCSPWCLPCSSAMPRASSSTSCPCWASTWPRSTSPSPSQKPWCSPSLPSTWLAWHCPTTPTGAWGGGGGLGCTMHAGPRVGGRYRCSAHPAMASSHPLSRALPPTAPARGTVGGRAGTLMGVHPTHCSPGCLQLEVLRAAGREL